jgi:uncharacterized protein YndB with AHSA1/START domain
VPTTSRTRVVAAEPAVVWRTVGDPSHQPRWWPLVARVEDVQSDQFTQLLKTAKGRGIRADFTIVERDPGRLLRYEQELPGSPFERIMRLHVTTIELAEADGGTAVTLTRRTKLRGLSSFGGFMWRRAGARQLDEALDGLARIHGAV